VVGSYVTDGTGIVAQAQVVDVPHLRMSAAVSARGEMRDLVAVFDSLAWKLTRQLDPGFSGSEDTFVAAGAGLRLDAFEQYIRGITEPDQQERLRHLKQAVQESPEFGPAWMALGREDYNGQQYEDAAAAFAKRLKDQTPAPGSEQAANKMIHDLFNGKPDDAMMSPGAPIHQQLAGLQSEVAGFGAIGPTGCDCLPPGSIPRVSSHALTHRAKSAKRGGRSSLT